MIRRITAVLAIMFGLVIGGLASAVPAQANINDCTQTYVCAWTNANYSGEIMQWQPSAIFQGSPAHCANFDATSMNDAISSMKSNNGAPNFQVRFYKDINCYNGGGWWTVTGTNGVANLAGTGWNDTFSSIYVPYCC